MFRDDKPLWMPPGSVRSILGLLIVALVAVNRIPEEALYAVLGLYFGQRGADQGDERT